MVEFTAEQIAAATGFPLPTVAECWGYLAPALVERRLTDRNTVAAAIATTAVECGFRCIGELPTNGGANFARYETLPGNTMAGDGVRYRGRGYIQLTFRTNYEYYGKMVDVDLVNDPERASEPAIAARVLAAYFEDRGIPALARAGKWEQVRVKVNGGTNGLTVFTKHVLALLALPAPTRDQFKVNPPPSRTWPAYPGEARLGMGSPGAPDAVVQVWQDILIRAGAIRDTPANRDGVYGPGMAAAVTSLQTRWGSQVVDGIAGPGTYRRITTVTSTVSPG